MQKENEKDNKSSSPTTINNEENDYTNIQLNLQDHINSLENPIFKEKLLKIYCYELYGKVFPKLNFLYENLLKNKNMLIEAQKTEEQKNK